MPLGRREPGQILEVGMQVDLLDRPGVLDGVAEPVVEVRVAHRAKGQIHTGIEKLVHWQASQDSGFSSEQAIASSSVPVLVLSRTRALTVACWMRVAGRE